LVSKLFKRSFLSHRLLLPFVTLIIAILCSPGYTRARQVPAAGPERLIGSQVSAGAAQGTEISAAGAASGDEQAPNLTRKDRVLVFEEVWKRISERYYDPGFNGIDWKSVHDRYRPRLDLVNEDGEFYLLLNKMVGELHDAHTRLHTPRERVERERLLAVTPGLSLWEVESKPVVIAVEPGSDAERAGIVPGMTVTSINGTPVARRLDQVRDAMGGSSTVRAERLRLYRRVLDGEPGTKFDLRLIDRTGKPVNATISLRSVSDAPEVICKQLPSGYGYIKLSLWKSPIHDRFRAALDLLRNSPGIVIDLRDNPGGEVNEVLKIAGYFFSHHEPFGNFITRSGKRVELVTSNNKEALYSGAVAVLINESSGSGSEMFAAALQELGRAVVIGRQSCGCLLGISEFKKLKGGGELAVSELGYVSPRGRRVEGTGVIPDESVQVTLSDLQSKRDLTLEEAETALRSHLKASTAVH